MRFYFRSHSLPENSPTENVIGFYSETGTLFLKIPVVEDTIFRGKVAMSHKYKEYRIVIEYLIISIKSKSVITKILSKSAKELATK